MPAAPRLRGHVVAHLVLAAAGQGRRAVVPLRRGPRQVAEVLYLPDRRRSGERAAHIRGRLAPARRDSALGPAAGAGAHRRRRGPRRVREGGHRRVLRAARNDRRRGHARPAQRGRGAVGRPPRLPASVQRHSLFRRRLRAPRRRHPRAAAARRRRSLPRRLFAFLMNLRAHIRSLHLVPLYRRAVVAARRVYFVRIRKALRTLQSGDSFDATLPHNLKSLAQYNTRIDLLIKPLSVLEQLDAGSKVLVVGPRNEHDLFTLAAHGFRNVRGLDLISYSPLIDLGDMHATPYPDDAW